MIFHIKVNGFTFFILKKTDSYVVLNMQEVLQVLEWSESLYEIPEISKEWWKEVRKIYPESKPVGMDWIELPDNQKGAVARLSSGYQQTDTMEGEDTIWWETVDTTGSYMLGLSVFLQCIKAAEVDEIIPKMDSFFWMQLAPRYEDICFMECD